MSGAGTDHTRESITGGPAIILVEPQLGENIGMSARAMANFGLSELRLVNPRENWLNQKTEATAAGAVSILQNAQIFPTVEAAIADLNFLYATTARERGQGKEVVGPDHAGLDLKARIAQGQKVGVLFGRERTGLENPEITLADAIVTFPVNPAYASLNLSQAVLLMSYSFMTAGGAATLPFERKTRWPPAERGTVLSFFDYLESQLEERGFFRPPQKRELMSRNLRNIFHRIEMSEQDLRTLRGMFVRLVEGPRQPQTKKRIRPPKSANAVPDQDGPS